MDKQDVNSKSHFILRALCLLLRVVTQLISTCIGQVRLMRLNVNLWFRLSKTNTISLFINIQRLNLVTQSIVFTMRNMDSLPAWTQPPISERLMWTPQWSPSGRKTLEPLMQPGISVLPTRLSLVTFLLMIWGLLGNLTKNLNALNLTWEATHHMTKKLSPSDRSSLVTNSVKVRKIV